MRCIVVILPKERLMSSAPLPPQQFRVLIIEDDAPIARLIEMNLARMNLSCRVAADGLAGIAAFKEFEPHLVITDIMMPHLNGRGVCAAIREHSMVPILMITAANSAEAELSAFQAGADDYIPKPFDPQLLAARVVANLRRVYRYDAEAYGAGSQ
jgi:DNA-binding response OmpR family regulator